MRDDFIEDVKRTLASRAGLICSNPGCETSTSGPQDDPSLAISIGVAAHITSASPGGPRYNPSLTPEQRKSAENGIWLCQSCAKMVDNDVSLFPVKLLDAWKVMREHNQFTSLGQTRQRQNETDAQKKCREILKWKTRGVMLVKMPSDREAMSLAARPWAPNQVTILDCNEFFVIVDGGGWQRTLPLDTVKIGWDLQRDCLELLEYPH